MTLRNDRLGTLVRELTYAFKTAPSWEDFVESFRGRSYLAPELDTIDHPAAELLRNWRDAGVPADMNCPPWTAEMKDYCIERGCHKSANEHAEFLREELSEFVESKYWVVLPYQTVRSLEHLMLSPAAVKEERERKPRLLCDHSWPWAGWPSINDSTIPHAPPEAMQFGRTLQRVCREVRHANPKFGPVRASKYDIKDGFYRLSLRARDCLRLALVFPKFPNEEQLVAIPLSTTMGWVQSPPTFCTMSETVCDLANRATRLKLPEQPHRLEDVAAALDDVSFCPAPRPREPEDDTANRALQSLPGLKPLPIEAEHQAPPSNCSFQKPLASTDVFVDDFIQLGQGGKKKMCAQRRQLLHAVDRVLAQPRANEPHRVEAVSIKKLLKGDGAWATRKLILGWILDTVRQTIELPPHRKQTLADMFTHLSSVRRLSRKKWQQYLGQLRFVSVAIPGSAGLFSALQLALNRAKKNRVRINRSLRSHLNAFASLAASLAHRPTHLAEIVAQDPSYLGATDAAKPGMGGAFFDHTEQGYVWRFPFPEDIQRDLISFSNPRGSVTNSDLEQAGQLGQLDVIARHGDVTYATLSNGSDNTPAVSRMNKGAVSSDGPAAHLCNYACMHQRQHRYCHHSFFIPGSANGMADDASRLQHLSDTAFLAHFQQKYPQPKPWKLLHLHSETASRLMLALRSKSPAEPQLPSTAGLTTRSSASGLTSATSMASPLPSITSLLRKTSSLASSSSSGATEPPASATSLYDLTLYQGSSRPLARGYPDWANQIPASRRAQPNSIPYSLISCTPCPKKMTRPSGPTQPTSPSCEVSSRPWTPSTRNSESSIDTSNCSPSSPSTGSSAPPNISTRPTLSHAAKPTSCATYTSQSTTPYTMPPTQTAL